jgi:hypothetical protein
MEVDGADRCFGLAKVDRRRYNKQTQATRATIGQLSASALLSQRLPSTPGINNGNFAILHLNSGFPLLKASLKVNQKFSYFSCVVANPI